MSLIVTRQSARIEHLGFTKIRDSKISQIEQQLTEAIDTAKYQLNQLVFLVAGSYTELHTVCNEIGASDKYIRVDINKELSARLVELPTLVRKKRVSAVFSELLQEYENSLRDSKVILIEGIEIIFEPSLALDPMRLLEANSRDKCLLVVWPGTLKNGILNYAKRGHPENKQYSANGLLTVVTNNTL